MDIADYVAGESRGEGIGRPEESIHGDKDEGNYVYCDECAGGYIVDAVEKTEWND